MQPDRTLVQLVSWVNLVETENERVLNAFRQVQEQNKELEERNKKLQADVDKLTKKLKDLNKED